MVGAMRHLETKMLEEDGLDDVKWLMVKEIPRLRRYALFLTGDVHTADDLVQDCLERAIRKRHLWNRHGSIHNWLFRILYNVFLNSLKFRGKKYRQVTLDEATAALAEAPRQEGRLAYREITEAIACLPAKQRAAIALTAVEGFSYDEASEILRIPIGTLRSRIYRGREALRELFDSPDQHVVGQGNSVLLMRARRK